MSRATSAKREVKNEESEMKSEDISAINPQSAIHNPQLKGHPFETVIFDLDDVLYPSRQYVLSGYKAVAAHVSNVYGVQIHEDLAARPRNESAERALATVLGNHFRHVQSSDLVRMDHVFRSHTPAIDVYPDARVCLAVLRNMHLKLGMVSTGPDKQQRAKVAALELAPLLDSILYTSDLSGDDKVADALRVVALDMEVSLKRAVFVGNCKTSDFAVAEQLGMVTVRVERERNTDETRIRRDTDVAAHATIHSLAGLHEVLDEIRQKPPRHEDTKG